MQKRARFDIIFTVRGVAQFGSALGSGPRGRGFKSRRLDHGKESRFVSALFRVIEAMKLEPRLLVPRPSALFFRAPAKGCNTFAGKGGTSHAATPRGTQRRACGLCSDAVRDKRSWVQIPSPRPRKRELASVGSLFRCYEHRRDLRVEARAESERFARELLGNISDGRKLDSPVGCSPGRAAKGANPVASTKTPRRHFCCLGVFAVVRGLNHSRRNVWKCDALFSAVGSCERTRARDARLRKHPAAVTHEGAARAAEAKPSSLS